ncbi:flavoprotein [Boeremia exigua]|uniref:flavoprotein n=1 Tax=Boeremia exigua TaxID=749465 RepID=UPI001E8CF3C0|nr:flavoprotein [Boeremia exigua]KAH6641975.1 flavoprotein [Boeremia exigua]
MLTQHKLYRLATSHNFYPSARLRWFASSTRCLLPTPSHGTDSPPHDHTCVSYMPARPRRVVVGITGATGTVYAIRILQILKELNIETHLVISKWAHATLKYETSLGAAEITELATKSYNARDVSAAPASGSFQHDGMIIVPCSMKTLAAVRCGLGEDLIARAADVSLKEGRKLVLVVRETPLNDIHLDNMFTLRRAGAVIFPPVPAFYTQPQSLNDVIDQSVGRMLDSMGIFTDIAPRWEGFERGRTVKGQAKRTP